MSLDNPDRFEVGSQIRRSSQGIKDTIVEGYGRRMYKADYIKFLIYAHSSLLEAMSQAEFIFEIYKRKEWEEMIGELDVLGKQISRYIEYVEKNWRV